MRFDDCLVTILVSNFAGGEWRGIRYNGKTLAAWEKEAVAGVADGSYYGGYSARFGQAACVR
jgi:hypothetical protein